MRGTFLRKRPLTPGYIFFYLLFLPDTWQIVIAVAAALVVAPHLLRPDMGPAGMAIVHVMIAGIVYVISAPVGRRISQYLQKFILKK